MSSVKTSILPIPAASSTPVNATPLLWQVSPGQPTYYINSTAISGDGSRVVGGTFFHDYGASSPVPPPPGAAADDDQMGTYGIYCYDRTGTELWKDEFEGWQGVYWVDISADGAFAASGGWFSQSPYAGFVRAFDAVTGERMLDYRTQKRVNQVVLSAEGQYLLSAAESLVLFSRSGGAYVKVSEFSAPAISSGSNYFVSAGLSADGSVVVCTDYAGNVMLLQTSGGVLSLSRQWTLPSGYSHMVRLAPNAQTFAAGGSSGCFYLFDTQEFVVTGQPTVTYSTGSSGSVYSVAVSDDGTSFVGVINSGSAGTVYFVQRNGSQGDLLWQYQTAHNPNCAWLNLEQGILAVADGHPDGSPGGFYLLETATGALRWQYPTSNMSWPIMISADGSGVVAGSDDSYIYYFLP